MKIESHLLGEDAKCCSRCGVALAGIPLHPPATDELRVGNRIGLITGARFTPDAAYMIRAIYFDSNPMCEVRT